MKKFTAIDGTPVEIDESRIILVTHLGDGSYGVHTVNHYFSVHDSERFLETLMETKAREAIQS